MIGPIEYPKRRWKLLATVVLSLVLHFSLYVFLQYIPLVGFAMSMRGIEFVDEQYDTSILINFSKPLQYPFGYMGFRPPDKTRSLDEMKKAEERRERLEARRRRQQEREEAAKRAEEEARAREEEKAAAAAAEIAKAQPTPTPEPTPDQKNDRYPGGFGKINTAPIRDQLMRLYEAKKAGKIVIPEGKLKVGVSGNIRPDGTLANCRITIPSGIKEIDSAALAILDAVSASRALGPLHSLTSLSMILDIDKEAQLHVVGFTSSEQEASNLVGAAQAAVFFGKIRKADDPAAMIMLNNLKVSHTGQRIQAVITVPRQTAADTMTKSIEKGQT